MGFAQEIKDFLSAAQAGQKIFGAKTDEEYKRARTRLVEAQEKKLLDPETDKLTKDTARANLAKIQAGIDIGKSNAASANALRSANTELIRERTNQLRKPVGAIPEPGDTPWSRDLRPAPPPKPAIPAAPAAPAQAGAAPSASPISYNSQAEPADEEGFDLAGWSPDQEEQPAAAANAEPAIPEEPVTYAGNGGLVGHYATGGLVEDIDDEEDDEDDTGSQIAASAAPGEFQVARGYSTEAAHDAARDGLDYGTKQLQKPEGIDPKKRAQMARAYTMGAGSLSFQEMQAVEKVVDPKGEMSPSNRKMAALANVYQWYLNKGDGLAAKRAAFSILQHYRQASQRYAAIAGAAANEGNVDAAAKAAMSAYDNIPTGNDLKVRKTKDGRFEYVVRDEKTGNEIAKGVATPQELAAEAMRVSANGFDEYILRAAGERVAAPKAEKAPKPEKPPAPMKPADAKNIRLGIDETLDSIYKAEDDKGNKNTAYDEKKADAWKVGAYQIQSSNPDLHPRQAIKAANDIMFGVDPKDFEARPFEIGDAKDGKKKITFPGTGVEIEMSGKQLAPLMVQRGLEIQRRKKEAEAATAESGKESTMSKVTRAGKSGLDAVGAIAEDAGRAGTAVGQAAKGVLDRSGISDFADTATSSVRSSARNALDAIRNKGGIPDEEFNSPL